MEQPVSFIVEGILKPGQQEAFQALVTEMIASAQGEPGTLSYEFFGSDDGTVGIAYERYADSAAALAHMTTWGQQFAPRVLESVTLTQFTVLGTISDELRAALSAMGPRYLHLLGSKPR